MAEGKLTARQEAEIAITCNGADVLPLKALQDFQGGLKKITKENLAKLRGQILKNGINVPAFVWNSPAGTYLLDGHQRVKALLSLQAEGYTIPGVPVAYIEASSVEDAKAKLLAITSQYGEFDKEGFLEFVGEIDLDLGTFRLVDTEVAFALTPKDETVDDDEIGEPPEAVTEPGDVWSLGAHRLLCGDSTDVTALEALMDGDKADLVFTDPPYNVEYVGKTKDALKIKNDSMGDSEFRTFLTSALFAAAAVSKAGAAAYICHADSEGYNFRGAFADAGWELKQCITWVKNSMVLGRQDYQWRHEPILYGWKTGAAHAFYGGRKPTTVWEIDRPSRSAEHPTMKPVELVERAVENSSKGDDIVLDPFLGSGTTLIACEKLQRACRGLELDPHYCDVIVQRYVDWCAKNNRKAEVLRNGEPCDTFQPQEVQK